MTTDDRIWIGQNNQKYGPYSEADIRQWIAEGKLATDALAWREGMENWVPLSSMFATAAGRPSPPPMPASGGVPPFLAGPLLAGGGRGYGPPESDTAARATFPAPPSLHWGLVLLFTIFTLGIFGIIWSFIQAGWIRKIDNRSNARLLLGIALTCFIVGYAMQIGGSLSAASARLNGDIGAGAGIAVLGGMLLLGYWVLYLVAYFSMAGSIRRSPATRGLPVEIGGVTLFFFTMYYLQSQLSWLAHWKETGRATPAASKGVLWALFLLFPFGIAILAAIAIPAYQDYLVRAQVAEGMVLADGAKTAMAEYYEGHHALPTDNASAGLAQSTSISGKYVSSVDVAGGVVTVAFDTVNSNRSIRYQNLVFLPAVTNDKISWDCSTNSMVPARDLPISCRK